MGNATLVSIVPFPVKEHKPGIYPGIFELNASKDSIPEVLVIGDSRFFVEIDEDRTIAVPCPAEQLASSIIEDYLTSNLAYSAEKNSMPGFFWVPGSLTKDEIIVKHSSLLDANKVKQTNWFKALIQIADDDWEKSRQHKFISDMQRHAARALKLERPWIINIKEEESVKMQQKCIACQTIVSIEAIVCMNCRCILKPEQYKNLQFAEA